MFLQIAGGGGGGGRISIHASDSNTFVGELLAFGGRSASEAGGAGTVYTDVNNTKTTLSIDNEGLKPTNAHVHGKLAKRLVHWFFCREHCVPSNLLLSVE